MVIFEKNAEDRSADLTALSDLAWPAPFAGSDRAADTRTMPPTCCRGAVHVAPACLSPAAASKTREEQSLIYTKRAECASPFAKELCKLHQLINQALAGHEPDLPCRMGFRQHAQVS